MGVKVLFVFLAKGWDYVLDCPWVACSSLLKWGPNTSFDGYYARHKKSDYKLGSENLKLLMGRVGLFIRPAVELVSTVIFWDEKWSGCGVGRERKGEQEGKEGGWMS